jgi:hypothetical protein
MQTHEAHTCIDQSTASKHLPKRSLLQAIHTQTIVLLDLHPGSRVLAVVGFALGQPFGGVLVSLLAVAGGAHCEELGAG